MNMLEGSLWNKILIFALPLAASSILQQLFNSADVAVVGRYVGSEALAAVGVDAIVINMLLNLFVGLSIGTNVVLSNYLGRKNDKAASAVVHTSVVLSLLCGVILGAVGIFIARPILKLISTPENIMDLAVLYLKIYFAGMPFIMLYNFTSAILRSKGDTKRPLFVLLFSGVLNLCLNLFFVIVCRMSVDGVALATVLSNVFSSLTLTYFISRESGALKLEIGKLRLHRHFLKQISRVGIPAGLQALMFSLANVIIQSALNKLGSDIVAASAAGMNYEYFTYFLINAFTTAAVTFISQNYGANKIDRCKKSMWLCIMMGEIFCVAMICAFLSRSAAFAALFTEDQVVTEYAVMRMKIVLPFEIVNAFLDIMSGALRGYGRSLEPALICVIGVCGIRLVWLCTAFAAHPTYLMLMWVYPISWIATAIGLSIAYLIFRRKLRCIT